MVTKQQQVEWLAKWWNKWPRYLPFVLMSKIREGCAISDSASSEIGYYKVTRKEWQQERDRQAELKAMTMQMCELKPLERYKMQKQDNSWHERGDLPPVGCECEWINESGVEVAAGAVYPDIGNVVYICAHKQTPGGDVIAIFTWELVGNGLGVAASRMPSDFRPLRTEREKAIDEMVKAAGSRARKDEREICEALYDAGYRMA